MAVVGRVISMPSTMQFTQPQQPEMDMMPEEYYGHYFDYDYTDYMAYDYQGAGYDTYTMQAWYNHESQKEVTEQTSDDEVEVVSHCSQSSRPLAMSCSTDSGTTTGAGTPGHREYTMEQYQFQASSMYTHYSSEDPYCAQYWQVPGKADEAPVAGKEDTPPRTARKESQLLNHHAYHFTDEHRWVPQLPTPPTYQTTVDWEDYAMSATDLAPTPPDSSEGSIPRTRRGSQQPTTRSRSATSCSSGGSYGRKRSSSQPPVLRASKSHDALDM
eukprot:Sspe_Gene.40505::Locus_19571_Transcript_1_3_Confidence_0.400_Length_950::g.40505::m.40505